MLLRSALRAGRVAPALPRAMARTLVVTFPSVCRGFSYSARRWEAPRPAMEPSATDRAEKTLQRFWKKVSVGYAEKDGALEHFTVLLDKRSLRTPGGNPFTVPADRPLLACLVAEEWDTQNKVMKPHSLPLTSLVSRAIDGLASERDRQEVEAYLMRYFVTDAICFHETKPDVLVRMQQERWDPLIAWTKEFFQIEVNVARGSLSNEQPQASYDRLAGVLSNLSPLDLASMERAVMTTKSIMTSFALLYAHIDAEQAALAAEVETASQASTWGAVEDAHDVDHAELRRQLASVACAQVKTEPELVDQFVHVLKTKYSA